MGVRYVLHALALTACFGLIARPDRLWSPVSPEIDAGQADQMLSFLTEPFTPSIDDRFGAELEQAIYSLSGYHRQTGEVARGENLDQILRRAGVEAEESHTFTTALRAVFDPRRSRPGDRYDLTVGEDGRIVEFSYKRGPLEAYRAEVRPDAQPGWDIRRVDVSIEHREIEMAGRLSDSLYGSFLEAGGDPDLVMAFVELFGWDVDFSRESQEGDEFRLVFDRLFVEGEAVGNGRVLAAQYRGSRGIRTAVYYKSQSAEGYFDPEGRSVRKSFLRSPLKFLKVTSRFSKARHHPILAIVRPHNGVDYGAPSGTPVRSVADGTVADLGWRGGAGNAVTIRHARGYETSYNHLSRFGHGVRSGTRVKQGEVIGYVGQTGLATGPHLDFRVKKDGHWVDPLKEKYVEGEPIPTQERNSYRDWLQRWTERLEAIGTPMQVAQDEGQ